MHVYIFFGLRKILTFFYLFLLELKTEVWNFYVFLRSLDCTTSDPIHVIHAFTPGALILDGRSFILKLFFLLK